MFGSFHYLLAAPGCPCCQDECRWWPGQKRARGAATVICRDKDGGYLGASAVVYDGLVNPATLEAQACKEALSQLASDPLLDSVVVASDCAEVVANLAAEVACRYVIPSCRRSSTSGVAFERPFLSMKRDNIMERLMPSLKRHPLLRTQSSDPDNDRCISRSPIRCRYVLHFSGFNTTQYVIRDTIFLFVTLFMGLYFLLQLDFNLHKLVSSSHEE